jgi:hypothetical protein
MFRIIKTNSKGGVFLRLFRHEKSAPQEASQAKEEAKCELCGFIAKTKSGLRLHKMKKHK